MAEKEEEKKIEATWFGGNSVGDEVSFGPKVYEYAGNSLRFSTNTVKLKFKPDTDKEKSLCLNTKLMLNTNKDNNVSPQIRNTLSTSDLKLGKWGKTNFSANLEDRVTVKFDDRFQMQNVQNSARLNLKAKKDDYQGYVALKFDCSTQNPELNFNGLTFGVQKDFGKKFSAYIEGYAPRECYQGNFKNTTYALGAVYRF